MEKLAITRTDLFGVRVIMTIMRVLVGELLYRAVTGHILVLECLLSDACGLLWSCHIMLDIKYRHFLRTRL
jgi:hypothetical protein